MDRVDINAKNRSFLLKRLMVLIAIYSFLFLIIGPKFTIWNIMDAHANGEMVHDRVFKFIKGAHEYGVIKLCFEGESHGKEGRMLFRTTEVSLSKREENVMGELELWTQDWVQKCDSLETNNIKFDVLIH